MNFHEAPTKTQVCIQERPATYFTLHLGFEKPATCDNLQQSAAKSQTKNANAI